MDGDNKFEPRPGRMRATRSREPRGFLNKVIAAAGGTGGLKRPSGRPFKGTLIGRGSAAARMLTLPDRYAGLRARRAIIKTRIVRLSRRALTTARAHLRYIQRDGVSRDGGPGHLYSAVEDQTDRKAFLDRCAGDRHQFRLILSAEDGLEYEDLKPLIRHFMGRMEEDLGTRLEWVAADHVNTLHPHTHVVLRGRDDRGENLVISPDYIKHGMRERFAGLVSIDLGPKTDFEIQRRRRFDVHAERLTSIDRTLLRNMDLEGVVASRGRDMFDHAIQTGRLRKLGALGLAEEIGGGRWLLDEDLENRLRAIGERHDIIRCMHLALKSAGLDRGIANRVIHRLGDSAEITGRLVARGLDDEEQERHFLVIDGIDGRSHYVPIDSGQATGPLPEGAIVRISARAPTTREGDGRNGRPSARDKPVEVELLSPLPLDGLPEHDGATWLDHELISPTEHPRNGGFGREVLTALKLRRSWLLEQGLASVEGEDVTVRPDALSVLTRRELRNAASAISRETGLGFLPVEEGSFVEGVVKRRLDLASGSFAVIDNGFEFSLLPWRQVLARSKNCEVSGWVRGGRLDINSIIDRERDLGR